MLNVISEDIEKEFYDPQFKGLKWEALIEDARARIDKAQNVGEMVTAVFYVVNRLDDSHTMFFPPERTSKPLFGFEAKAIGQDVYVYEIKKKGAAEKAGLKAGDKILTVNGFNALRENWDLMMIYFRVLRPVGVLNLEYQRGNGPVTKLTLEAEMKNRPIVTDMTQSINIWEFLREWDTSRVAARYQMYDGGIGYLQLEDFMASEALYKSLVKKVEGGKAVIVDLRGNPGGAVDYLQKFAAFFEPERRVMFNIVTRKKTEAVEIKPQKTVLNGPMFILIDSQSSSAAELFARYFQLRKRAVVIGDDSSGRVTVARFFGHTAGQDTVAFYGVQVAIGRAKFEDGSELEKSPVKPDRRCLPTSDDLANDRDPCRSLAILLARQALGLGDQIASDTKPEEVKD
jgi:carboxyl-terminal processing protease